jgi:hypothetical protein
MYLGDVYVPRCGNERAKKVPRLATMQQTNKIQVAKLSTH